MITLHSDGARRTLNFFVAKDSIAFCTPQFPHLHKTSIMTDTIDSDDLEITRNVRRDLEISLKDARNSKS